MATTKATARDLLPVPQPPGFHPTITVTPPSHDDLHFWKFMVARSIADMIEHMAMFPVDTIKTQMQALGSCPIKSASLSQALKTILKSQGPAGLYRGIFAMGLGAGPAHAIYFSIYENRKERFVVEGSGNGNAVARAGVCGNGG
ncbi:Mitoferrin [Heracleum sosnowskyi]|uniref:Mitoferrin n=1 Tax=Heracleum sosnowskyi TaxID=360622 RepID=A0AAD8MAP7_9APIA|nr:Mitoferrin [Heracleum sosnowskyi]